VFFTPSVQSAMSLLLMIVSVVICVLLIVAAVALRRTGVDDGSKDRDEIRCTVNAVLGR
jgi:hypothetical protein